MDETLTGTTSLDQSGPGNNDNKEVLIISLVSYYQDTRREIGPNPLQKYS